MGRKPERGRKPPEQGRGCQFEGLSAWTSHPHKHLHANGRKTRDLFPLPKVSVEEDQSSIRDGFSRKVLRRRLRAGHIREEVDYTVSALNSMYGCGRNEKAFLSLDENLFGTAAAQYDSLEFIESTIKKFGKPPEDLDSRGALAALQAPSGHAESQCQPAGSLATFNIETLSLPDAGWKPICLAKLWGSDGQKKLDDFMSKQLLPPEIARARVESSGLERPYTDPLLKHGKAYHGFLKRMHDSNLVDFSIERGVQEVGVFCVTKKSGKLRLIIDARLANCHFEEPAHVALTTGEGLSSLEFSKGESVTVAAADLKDAFYHLSLPEEIRPYFSLPRVRARDVGVFEISGRSVKSDTFITPRVAVVPMGWSWALYLCQSVHEALAGESGLHEQDRLRDKKPAPNTQCCHLQYVDNMIVLGSDSCQVKECYDRAVKCLKDAGLQVHEEEFGEGGAVLGWEITRDGIFRPTHKRAWRVRLAIRGLLRRGRSTSKLLEKLVGHCSFLCLGRRECFSVFGEVYRFIQQHRSHNREISLWKGVQRELMQFDGIIPLIQRDLTATWSPIVHAVDASEFGMGATTAVFSVDEARQLGQYNERWRFKDADILNPRSQVLHEQRKEGFLGEHVVVPLNEAEQPLEVVSNFTNVPFEAVDRDWRTVGSHRRRAKGTLPVFEARSSLYAVKHILRNRGNFGKKHLIFTDSLTAACALSRGRSSRYNLRRVCMQIGALALSTNSVYNFRWIPSEWNPADNPSRGIWSPSVPKRFFSDGDLQAPATGFSHSLDRVKTEKASCQENHSQRLSNEGAEPLHFSDEAGDFASEQSGEPRDEKGEAEADQGQCREKTQREDHFGGSFSVTGMSGKVPILLESCIPPVADLQGSPQEHRDSGSRVVPISGGAVLRRGRYKLSAVHSCQRSVFQPQLESTWERSAPTCEAELEGMEEALSNQVSNAGALGGYLPPCARHDWTWEDSPSFAYPSHAHFVPASFGGTSPQTLRCGEAYQRSRMWIPGLDICSSPNGDGNSLKDTRIRRESSAGPPISSGNRRLSLQMDSKATAREAKQDIRSQHTGAQQPLGEGREKAELREDPCHPRLPVSTRRRIIRLCDEAPGSHIGAASGTLEKPELSAALPKGSSPGAALRRSPGRRAKTVQSSSKQSGKYLVQGALSQSVCPSLNFPVFIEIFSGSVRLGRAVSQSNGWPVLLWDITLGAEYDLLQQHNRWKITGWLRSGLLRGGHLGTPCNTFTRARDRQPGPPPLRSNEYVMGLPGLSGANLVKVSQGNLFVRFSVQILTLAAILKYPFTMENPANSRIWWVPAVVKILRRRCCQLHFCEFCMFGCPWRKPTAFLSIHCDLSMLDHYRCLGAKRGLCKRSGNKHIPLCGQTSNGVWMTKVAEPYPPKLCKMLAICFANFEAQTRADNFSKRL